MLRHRGFTTRGARTLAIGSLLCLLLGPALGFKAGAAPSAASALNLPAPPLLPGQGVRTKTLRAGRGATVQPGLQVSLRFTAWLADGKVALERNTAPAAPLTFVVGAGEVIRGWEAGVLTMKVGEKRRIVIPPEAGYGAHGRPPSIPPNATLILDVELVGLKRGKQMAI